MTVRGLAGGQADCGGWAGRLAACASACHCNVLDQGSLGNLGEGVPSQCWLKAPEEKGGHASAGLLFETKISAANVRH